MIVEVLTEGASDAPVIRELLSRHFGLVEHEDFHIYPHRGKGKIPDDLNASPPIGRRGLLDQLPAKLRGWGRYMDESFLVLVLIDADDQSPQALLADLNRLLQAIAKPPPNLVFAIAVEETESWFIADLPAMEQAFPRHSFGSLQWIQPDAVVGAWERIAECFNRDIKSVTGGDKTYWAENIAPHMNFDTPRSPSLRQLVEVIESKLQ